MCPRAHQPIPQVLSDPNLRHIYNMNGQRSGGGVEPAGGFQDPDVVLGMMFGGERFRDLVGEISIGTLAWASQRWQIPCAKADDGYARR
jgi:DnaJ-class molecular chaperone